MKNTLGSTLMMILMIATLVIIYTIEVGGDFSSFSSKALVKALIYLIIPVIAMYIAQKFSKKK